jgi:hypothetical protein
VAFSKSVRGAGIVAGGPYYCAQGSVTRAISQCASGVNVDELVRFTKSLPLQDRDDISHLIQQNLYLFSGTLDSTGVLS